MLHIVSRSPFSSSALSECISHLKPDSALLLLGSGVYAINHPILNTIEGAKIYALREDAESRGLNSHAGVEYIDYPRMVQLTEQHYPSQTWS